MEGKETDFPNLRLARSCALSLSSDPSYVLHFAMQMHKSDGGDNSSILFAAVVSGTHEIKLYSKDTFCSQATLHGHSDTITTIKFDSSQPHIIWSASLDGTLRFWDTTLKNDAGHIVSQITNVGYTSFDISHDGAILATGTEHNEETETPAIVQFWDIRKLTEKEPKCLAKFEDIHSDDITKIVFHPTNSKIVATGSTDGLISILDLTTFDEDDALVQTLNTESSVSTFGFFGPNYEFLYTLTHIETFQIWKYIEGDLLTSLTDLRKKVPKSTPIDYVVDCLYYNESQRLFLIGGTHRGVFEILHVNLDVIEPYQTLNGGHSSTIRCIANEDKLLLTGAEDGMVCAWIKTTDTVKKKSNSKQRKSKSRRKKNPYKMKSEDEKT